MAFFVAGLSLIGHKEIRFLLPILPILHIIIGKYLHHIDPSHRYSAYSRNFLILTSFIHFTAALYLGLFHQVQSNKNSYFVLHLVSQAGTETALNQLADIISKGDKIFHISRI